MPILVCLKPMRLDWHRSGEDDRQPDTVTASLFSSMQKPFWVQLRVAGLQPGTIRGQIHRIAALTMATGTMSLVVYAPSEHNPADPPSRGRKLRMCARL